jgi:hypothetical protein
MLRFAPNILRRACLVAGTAMLAGCAVYAEPAPGGHGQPGQPVHIPPGHYPPPGQCRVWYPDRPPGHQPPPGPCEVLQYQVPPGAVLVQG